MLLGDRPASAGLCFVIIAAPRTGSNMLCSMLNSHPQILCHHELFNPEGIHCALDWRVAGAGFGTLADRDRDPREFLAQVWMNGCGASAVGFKMNRGQNSAAFRLVLPEREIRKILLIRRNRLRTFVSERIAEHTGVWESYAFSEVSAVMAPVEVDVLQLREHIATNRSYYDRIREALRSTGQEYLEVAYEDLAAHSSRQRLLTYLGVAQEVALSPATRKVARGELSAMIANYDSLAAELAGTDLEHELRLGDCQSGIEVD
jgi:LPS sulfotransferase NodH